MGFAGDSCLEVVRGAADRQAGGRISGLLQVFQVAVGMPGFALCGGAKDGGYIVVTLDVGLGGEVQVAAVGLGFAGEGVFEVLFGLAVLSTTC